MFDLNKLFNKKKNRKSMNKIRNVLEKIYNDRDLRKTCIPLFLGNPGLGKTKIIEQFANEKGVQLLEVIASQLMPHEISGIAIPNQETKLMSYFDFDRFLTLKDGDILFFDELLNANPMVLNACLTLLENRRMISGKPLANIMIVAAANKQGATILTPQIKERFIFYDVKFHDKLWAEYMYKKYNIIDECLVDLVTLIKNENFENSRVNYFTPRSIDKAISMMIREVETPYEKDLNPILNKLMTNTSPKNLKIGDLEWLKDEKISWLTFARATHKANDVIIESEPEVKPEPEIKVKESNNIEVEDLKGEINIGIIESIEYEQEIPESNVPM